MRRIGIVGSRSRDTIPDYQEVVNTFTTIYKEGDTIVSGGCQKGGDRFAEIIAKGLGLTITIHYPDWDKHKKSAGFVRNTLIANDCDVLIACVAGDRTGGTEDTIKKVLKQNKEVIYC